MKRSQSQEPAAAPAAADDSAIVEILRNFHIDEPTGIPDRSTRKSFLAGDKHVVDKDTAKLWTAQGHAKLVEPD